MTQFVFWVAIYVFKGHHRAEHEVEDELFRGRVLEIVKPTQLTNNEAIYGKTQYDKKNRDGGNKRHICGIWPNKRQKAQTM